MGTRCLLPVGFAVLAGVSPVQAQVQVQELPRAPRATTAPKEPPPLRLQAGLKVRVWTHELHGAPFAASAGKAARAGSRGVARIEGLLASAEGGRLRIVPEGGDALEPVELELALRDVERLELGLGRKRHWLRGLLVGAIIGVLTGLGDDVDPEMCKVNDNVSCSRGQAVAEYGLSLAAAGAGVGALVQTQVWTPVAIDALDTRPVRSVRSAAAVSFTVRF